VDLADGEVSGEGMSTSVLASLRRSLWARVERARASVGGGMARHGGGAPANDREAVTAHSPSPKGERRRRSTSSGEEGEAELGVGRIQEWALDSPGMEARTRRRR
jgi:hypothetical protein